VPGRGFVANVSGITGTKTSYRPAIFQWKTKRLMTGRLKIFWSRGNDYKIHLKEASEK
jgi:hypothetical protein